MKEESGECFICLEETPLLSPCLCKNVYLCENCVVKLRLYNFNECKVCGSDYPEPFETDIDINIILTNERGDKFSFLPCCLRPRSSRGDFKQCVFDFFIHTLCIYLIMVLISCSVTFDSYCYGQSLIWYFIPSLLIYIMSVTFLSSVRRR